MAKQTRRKYDLVLIIYFAISILCDVCFLLKKSVFEDSEIAYYMFFLVYFIVKILIIAHLIRITYYAVLEKRNKLTKCDYLILEAFLETRIIPHELQRQQPQLFDLDTTIAGYCKQLLKGKKNVELSSNEIISEDEKKLFLKLIDGTRGYLKEELVIYYRLLLSVESILCKYRQPKQNHTNVKSK